MRSYNKAEIKDAITEQDILDLLNDWGANPMIAPFGIICNTICHNPAGEGSRKLYYYTNTRLFKCFTGCAENTFDIFELTIKVSKIQWNKDYDLNEAIRYIAIRFNIDPTVESNEVEGIEEDEDKFEDWQRIKNISLKTATATLKPYDESILDKLNYKVKILPWLEEGITQEVMNYNRIGYYAGGNQITIPHYDIDGNFIGLRGRTLSREDAERYGKYRPIICNHQMYNHPLGLNLYNLNNSKENIKIVKKAIIFESEKSTMLYQSIFGIENDISVACCGSNLSTNQFQLLENIGVNEIIIGFDRQFKEIGDDEFKHLTSNYEKIYKKYHGMARISFIFDIDKITAYKASPIDEGKEKFEYLFKNRRRIEYDINKKFYILER